MIYQRKTNREHQIIIRNDCHETVVENNQKIVLSSYQ